MPSENGRSGFQDAEVVSVEQLAPLIEHFIQRYRAERPMKHKRMGVAVTNGEEFDFFGAIPWLVQETGLQERAISRIIRREQKYVGLTNAERILMALDLDYMLTNDEIQVVPNPLWSQEKWHNYMEERGCI